MPELLAVAEAQARLLALGTALPVETIALADAAGRWAAEDIVARRTQPARDLSAMDGYAIRHADLPGPLTLIGESAAGRPFVGAISEGQTIRIFTGAALPDGADCVLVQEEAARDGEAIRLAGEGPRPGGNVRRRGLDFSAGDALIAAGERLTPARIALAAVGGIARIPARRRLRLTIAATGDELVSPESANVGVDMLPESNAVMLAAQLATLPCDIEILGILPDDLAALTDAFSAVDCDILLTTGGASVGDRDLVRPALEAAGGSIDFWRIALRPGKPMLAGRLGDTVFVGLPGNPVSAFVTAELFVKPLISAMCGAAARLPATFTAPLGEALPPNGERTDYIRAARRDGRVFAPSLQDSSMLRTLARADCLIVRPPNARAAREGELVDILPIA